MQHHRARDSTPAALSKRDRAKLTGQQDADTDRAENPIKQHKYMYPSGSSKSMVLVSKRKDLVNSSLSTASCIRPSFRPILQGSAQKPCKPLDQTEDGALSVLIAKKGSNRLTTVYSGNKRSSYKIGSEVPSLSELCIEVLQEHVNDIKDCLKAEYKVLQPVLERASPTALARIEELNQYLMTDTGPLWERIVKRHFPKARREEMESPREMYERCLREREEKLEVLKMKIKVKNSYQEEESAAKRTKMAYGNPSSGALGNVRKIQYGLSDNHPLKRGVVCPPAPASFSPSFKTAKKVAPLMSKSLKMARGAGYRR